MAKQKQQGNGVATEENPVVEISGAEHPEYTATGELRKQTAKPKGRRKAKGPRSVFYMAVKPLQGYKTVREVTRADTRNQLDKKLQTLQEVSDEFKDDVYILQCRPQ